MCKACDGDLFFDYGLFGGRGSRYADPFGFDGDVDRRSFASVSQRAQGALENSRSEYLTRLFHYLSPYFLHPTDASFKAKRLFIDYLAKVDTSKGPVTSEIINFHLVPDMRKAFNKYVREYGCTATSRQLSRAEQDQINKTRKSLLWYTSVKVTPEAQQTYLEKHPAKQGSTRASTSSTVGPSTSPVATAVSASPPLRDITHRKTMQKMNQAAVAHAAQNPSIEKHIAQKKV
ncbi:hypothetical protein CPB83DRAFT_892374 [Crepidotus variabilis]|uniref:Uncharacterized protein n=1 Tax=Crepidotus variabilis TaxID=179855 RepID=A0A9P6JRF6_9AGAR|nr:hypothetical protein CPB83DRAFT_892374 [Crepidotus variabilis]